MVSSVGSGPRGRKFGSRNVQVYFRELAVLKFVRCFVSVPRNQIKEESNNLSYAVSIITEPLGSKNLKLN